MKKLNEILPDVMKSESPIETTLYGQMRRYRIPCELQYKIKGIRFDIAIPSIKLAIECDGKEFHKDNLKDKSRDIASNKQGWEVRRFTGSDIFLNAKDIAKSLAIELGYYEPDPIPKPCTNCGGYGRECICISNEEYYRNNPN